MRWHLILAAICACTTAGAQQPVSKYAAETREQARRTKGVADELMEMIRQSEDDPETIISVGRRFQVESDRSIKVARNYRDAKTRFGLQSELDDFVVLLTSLRKGKGSLEKLTGIGPRAYSPTEIDETYSMLEEDVIPMIKQFVDMEMEAQGVGDFLTDPGFETASNAIKNRIEADIRSQVEDEIKQVIGMRISVGHSLRYHIMMSAKGWVSSKIHGLVFRIAINSFVVEFLGKKILDWAGPRLKELLRHKGSLEPRVDRALEKMREREIHLHSLDSESDMAVVRRSVESALQHVNKANAPLRGDLKKEGKDDLYQKLAEGETRLADAVKLTRTRFLMNSELVSIVFDDLVDSLETLRDEIGENLDAFIAKTKTGSGPSKGSADYRAFATATYARAYKGEYRVRLTPKGKGVMISVVDPQGALIANHELTRDLEYKSPSRVRFETDSPSWSSGTQKAAKLTLTTVGKEKSGNGLYQKYSLTWIGKNLRTMLSLTCQIVDTSKFGVSKVFKGGENNLYNRAYWGSYTAEVTQSNKSCHVRVIGPKGHVIENQDLSLNSDKSTLTFDLYENGNPAWPTDNPASMFELKVFKRRTEEDALITVTWYSKRGSRIFSLAMRPPKN